MTAGAAPRRSNQRAACAVLAVALAGCSQGPSAVTIRPVVDGPSDDMDATPLGLDTVEMSVAHAGGADQKLQLFKRGQALELSGLPFGDDLVVHMWGPDRDVTDNIAYGRTCVVSVAADAPVPEPHLFFSRKGKFATLDIRPVTRVAGLSIPYLGSALLIAGHDDDGPVTEVERFDPSTGEFHPVGMVGQRDQAVQALFTPPNGPQRALVIGGSANNLGVNDIDVIEGLNDGLMRMSVATSDMGRVGLTATTLGNGNVIVVGGRIPGGPVVGDIDEIAPSASDSMPLPSKIAMLAHPRAGHTATRIGDARAAEVLIAGGADDTGTPVGTAERFDPLSNGLIDTTASPPIMVHPRSGHAAVPLIDGSVVFIGGLDATGPVRELEGYRPGVGFFRYSNAVLSVDQAVVDFATTILPDGRILVTGGRAGPAGGRIERAYVIDTNPFDGTPIITPTDSMMYARAGHQAVLLCDGTVLITGGAPPGFPAERYNPPDTGRR